MIRLALRNIARQKMRTAITLAAIVFGVAGIIVSGGFVRDILVQLGEAVIHSQSGHIQITKKGFLAEGARKPERYEIEAADRVLAEVRALPAVADAMARSTFSALLNNGRADLAIAGEGIDADKEAKLGTYVSITAGRALTGRDANGALIGQGVAKALNVVPGDRVTMLATTAGGAMNTVDVEVIGVFQSFSKDYDARAVKVPLIVARELSDSRGVQTIVVSLARTDDTDAVASMLRSSLSASDMEVTTWPDLNDFYSKTVALYDRQFGILQIIIVVSVVLSVVNSMNMSIFERVREFGTMRALGNRSSTVLALVVTESLLLGSIGGALGVVAGTGVAAAISMIGIPMPPPPNADLGYIAHIQIVPSIVVAAFACALIAAVAAGVICGLRVSAIPVVTALRSAR